MPKSWHTTRIENRYGGGVPDVHVCAEGIPFWIELKTTKTNRVNVSAHQVAWNFAYCQSGGVSFYLVKALSSSNLYLFDGVHGRGLMEHGLKSGRSGSGEVGSGTIVPCLWSGDSWSGLLDHMIGVGRDRVAPAAGLGLEYKRPRRGERKTLRGKPGLARLQRLLDVSTTGAEIVNIPSLLNNVLMVN